MTGVQQRRRSLASEAGFTMIEMLIATLIIVVVTGAVFDTLDPASGAFNTQPEAADMQQRLRVGVDSLYKDLVMAGSGTYTYSGASAGALGYFFAPVLPYRIGNQDADPPAGVFFRDEAISLIFAPQAQSQTITRTALASGDTVLRLRKYSNCPTRSATPDPDVDANCDLGVGSRVLITDGYGAFDIMSVDQVAASSLTVAYPGALSVTYPANTSLVSEIMTSTFYLNTDVDTGTFQLMHYDGFNAPLPIVDNVVKLQFEYFGDPLPPQRLANKPLSSSIGPWTTYGPKPYELSYDSPGDAYLIGENCTFKVEGGQHVPRLATLAGPALAQVPLPESILDGSDDGPWCPDVAAPNRYDADLLRVRRVRVTIRVQVAQEWLRGPSATLFRYPGSASGSKYVPDQELRFDVSPRNLNLGR